MNETPATVRMIDGATAPAISNVFVNNACAVCTLQITGSFTAATVLVEGIVNVASNQWVTLAAFNLSDLSLEKDGADKAGIYQVGIEGILRVRMNVTEISGGDITIAAQFGNAIINQFSKTEASNLIPITAYDLAVAGGYTGTLEQFEADMGNSASNATAAAESAASAAQTLTDVQTAGTEAVDAVQTKGQEVLTSIPEDYTELTGEVSDLKTQIDGVNNAIVSNDARLNESNSTVNYAYSVSEEIEEKPSSSSQSERLGAKQNLSRITLNISNPTTSADVRLKLSNGLARAVTNSGIDAWATGIQLVDGHEYEVAMNYVSGTISVPEGTSVPYPFVIKAGAHGNISTKTTEGYNSVATFTSDGSPVNIGLAVFRGTTLMDAVYDVVLEDVTARSETFKSEVYESLPFDPDVIGEDINKIYSTVGAMPDLLGVKLWGHLFIDGIESDATPIIPSESLFEIQFSKRVGFRFIEGHLQRTSDGKYIVMHGANGKIGYELITTSTGETTPDVVISSLSFDDIRQNYVYRSTLDKYKTPVCSADEWLLACKNAGMTPIIKCPDDDALTLVKSYFGNAFVLYQGTRTQHSGFIMYYQNDLGATVAEAKAAIDTIYSAYGTPLILCIFTIDNYTDDDFSEIVRYAQGKGILFATANCYYNTRPSRVIRTQKAGVDLAPSGWEVPTFDIGNIADCTGDTDFSEFTTTGTVQGGNLSLAQSGTVEWSGNSNNVQFGKGQLKLRFNGRITVKMGRYYTYGTTTLKSYSNDGSQELVFTTYFLDEAPTFKVTALDSTTIQSISYKAFKC